MTESTFEQLTFAVVLHETASAILKYKKRRNRFGKQAKDIKKLNSFYSELFGNAGSVLHETRGLAINSLGREKGKTSGTRVWGNIKKKDFRNSGL